MAKQELGPIQERWLAALESGTYDQGQIALKRESLSESGLQYCCLGVLCEVLEIPWEQQGPIFSIPDDAEGTIASALPISVCDKVGLRGPEGPFRIGLLNNESSLAWANDKGATFTAIAAHIRANPEDVFIGPR